MTFNLLRMLFLSGPLLHSAPDPLIHKFCQHSIDNVLELSYLKKNGDPPYLSNEFLLPIALSRRGPGWDMIDGSCTLSFEEASAIKGNEVNNRLCKDLLLKEDMIEGSCTLSFKDVYKISLASANEGNEVNNRLCKDLLFKEDIEGSCTLSFEDVYKISLASAIEGNEVNNRLCKDLLLKEDMIEGSCTLSFEDVYKISLASAIEGNEVNNRLCKDLLFKEDIEGSCTLSFEDVYKISVASAIEGNKRLCKDLLPKEESSMLAMAEISPRIGEKAKPATCKAIEPIQEIDESMGLVKIESSDCGLEWVVPQVVERIICVPFLDECNGPILEGCDDYSWLLPKRATLSYMDGSYKGSCYPVNYTTFGLLFANEFCKGIIPIVDIRGHYLKEDLFATNVGVGFRYVPESNCFYEVLGMNAYYDFRQGCRGDYHQIGLGLEVLGDCWDFRANGYFPISRTEFKKVCLFDKYNDGMFATRTNQEFIFWGYNAELGAWIWNYCDFSLYAAAGPYYWSSSCFHTRGGRVRLRPQYKDYIALDLSYSYDSIFGSLYMAQIIFYLPLYQYPIMNKSKRCDCRIYEPIERFDVMPLGKKVCWRYNWDD